MNRTVLLVFFASCLSSSAYAGITSTIEVYSKVGSSFAPTPGYSRNTQSGAYDAVRGGTRTGDSSFTGTGYAGVYSSSRWQHYFIASTYDYNTYLQVDLSQFAETSILNASLEFNLETLSSSDGTGNIRVSSFDADGIIGGGLPGSGPVPIAGQSTVYDTYADFNSIDITEMVRNRVEHDETWLGLYIENYRGQTQYTFANASYYNDGTLYNSSYDSAQVRLIVDYVPEPVSSGSLVILAASTGIAGLRQRTRARARFTI